MIVSTKTINNRIYAFTPFNRDFISEAKLIGGRYDADQKAWHFDASYSKELSDVLINLFGTDGSDTKTVTARITVTGELKEYNGPIIICGREIARATGRDSGARAGHGVVFIEKKPQSGGSVKNWATVINQGTIFDIQDFPESALTMLNEIYQISFEVQAESTEKDFIAEKIEKLKAERDRINAEIAELESKI